LAHDPATKSRSFEHQTRITMDTTVERNTAGMPAAYKAPLIVHVVRQFHPNKGGLEDVVFNLARQGVEHGYRVRVVTLNSLFSNPDLVLAERETLAGIEIVRIAWKGSSRYPVAPSVLRHIADADLVHVHAVDFFFDFLALTKLFHRKRMIATTHGGFFHTQRFAAIKNVWFQTLTRFSASRYSQLVGCSQSDMETFSPIAGNNLSLIVNGADTAKFRDLAARQPSKRLVTIGRFSVNKRLDHLIATIQALVAGDPDWHLDIIGVGSDLSAQDVERLIAAHRLAGHVSLHVGLSNAEIGAVIGTASLFVSASEYEGFGLVAIEAMSAGLLPVLQDNEAYRALAARHAMFTLADFTDTASASGAIAGAYARLASDPNGVRQRLIGESEGYSWDNVAGRYFDLYARVLG
jgi:alpha-1,3-mannosyltransferase